MAGRLKIVLIIFSLSVFTSFGQTNEIDYDSQFLDYLYSNSNSYKIKNNDTISFIKKVLEEYKGASNKNSFLTKYTIPDSIFGSYPTVNIRNSKYDGRIFKRTDFSVLFIIYFELYLKYQKPSNLEIITIQIVSNKKVNTSYIYSNGVFDDNLEAEILDFGKQYVDGQILKPYVFENTYVPVHLTMEEIYLSFEKWITKILKLGSLEKARRKGLDPFKKLGFRFNIIYAKKVNPANSAIILVKELNSYFPRYPKETFIEKKEIIDSHWSSSYRDSNKW